MQDITIRCACGKDFTFTTGEQQYYEERGYQRPKRCAACREKKKERNMSKLEREQRQYCKRVAAEDPTKTFGVCDSCGAETVLLVDTGMCGLCTFGEADTINGNW